MTGIDRNASPPPSKRLPRIRTLHALFLQIVENEARTRRTALLMRTALWPLVAICVIFAAVLTVAIVFYPLSTIGALTGFGAAGGTAVWRRRRSR